MINQSLFVPLLRNSSRLPLTLYLIQKTGGVRVQPFFFFFGWLATEESNLFVAIVS